MSTVTLSGHIAAQGDVASVGDPLTLTVGAAAGGEQWAWEALVDRYAGLVGTIARNHRLGPADAAEVAQTTWMRLVENIGRIRQPHRVQAWIATTARRECLRVIRTSRRTVSLDDTGATELRDITSRPPDEGPLFEDRSRAVRRAYERLPERCQRLLGLLCGEAAVDYKSLARRLDMPIGSIGPTRGRCLETLRRLVDEEEGVPAGP